jgi:hypothetical protein
MGRKRSKFTQFRRTLAVVRKRKSRGITAALFSCLLWLRGQDLNLRPLGYEPNELPDCSTPRHGGIGERGVIIDGTGSRVKDPHNLRHPSRISGLAWASNTILLT